MPSTRPRFKRRTETCVALDSSAMFKYQGKQAVRQIAQFIKIDVQEQSTGELSFGLGFLYG